MVSNARGNFRCRTSEVNALGGGMAFQAMNHGLEAHATSSPIIRAIHNVKADRVLVALAPYAGQAHQRNRAARRRQARQAGRWRVNFSHAKLDFKLLGNTKIVMV